MNTDKEKVLFFIKREYGAPSIELRAYKVEKSNDRLAFLELERLRLVVFSGSFQSITLNHEYGKNNCMYNSAENIPDLIKDMKKWQLSPIDRRNYERFRKVAIGIYRKAGIIDFTTLETTPIK